MELVRSFLSSPTDVGSFLNEIGLSNLYALLASPDVKAQTDVIRALRYIFAQSEYCRSKTHLEESSGLILRGLSSQSSEHVREFVTELIVLYYANFIIDSPLYHQIVELVLDDDISVSANAQRLVIKLSCSSQGSLAFFSRDSILFRELLDAKCPSSAKLRIMDLLCSYCCGDCKGTLITLITLITPISFSCRLGSVSQPPPRPAAPPSAH
jgi:hypothetical protein